VPPARAACRRPRRLAPALALLALLAPGCVSGPPRDPRAVRAPDLVPVAGVDPSLRIELRYATANNFAGRAVYPATAEAYLQRPAAAALARAAARVRPEGFGLLVYDAYRPWRVTNYFWEITPPEQRNFVADPKAGSRHNRGCAVDLTLYDLATGAAVAMPSAYDEFSARAHPAYAGGTDAERRHRDLLRAAMAAEGFTVNDDEWWHFDFRGWEEWPVLDVGFEELAGRRGRRRSPEHRTGEGSGRLVRVSGARSPGAPRSPPVPCSRPRARRLRLGWSPTSATGCLRRSRRSSSTARRRRSSATSRPSSTTTASTVASSGGRTVPSRARSCCAISVRERAVRCRSPTRGRSRSPGTASSSWPTTGPTASSWA
jgi:D-alanyl-D-alanine dipeptidase